MFLNHILQSMFKKNCSSGIYNYIVLKLNCHKIVLNTNKVVLDSRMWRKSM